MQDILKSGVFISANWYLAVLSMNKYHYEQGLRSVFPFLYLGKLLVEKLNAPALVDSGSFM